VAGGAALVVGAASGLLLYAGTRAFVAVASTWEPFRRNVVSSYQQAAEVSKAGSLLLSLAITVPAEELFWRGLVQARLDQSLAALAAAGIAWGAYVAVNAASANLPIVAAAVVGGAVWAGLAAWSGGVLASLASHMLWTGLMLALPPGAGRGVRAD
jgi:membrane protease YdiL (CAAX protease family)